MSWGFFLFRTFEFRTFDIVSYFVLRIYGLTVSSGSLVFQSLPCKAFVFSVITLYWISINRCIGICSLIPAERTPSLRKKPPKRRRMPATKINITFSGKNEAIFSRMTGKMKPSRTIPPQKISFFSPNKRRRTESFPCSEAL